MLSFWFLFFIITISPSLKHINVGYPIAADRYFYFAGIGIISTFVLLVHGYFKQYYFFLILTPITLMYVVISFQRVDVWKDNRSLFGNKNRNSHINQVHFKYKNLGVSYEKEGKIDLAILNYNRYLKKNPTDVNIVNSLSNLYLIKRDTLKSLKLFKHIVEQDSTFYLAYYNMANIYKAQNKFYEAIPAYRKTLSIKNRLPEAHNNLAVCYILTKDTLNAFSHFKQAHQLSPQNTLYKDNYLRIASIVKQISQ